MGSFFSKSQQFNQQVQQDMVNASQCIKASEVFVAMYCLLSFIIVLNANAKYNKYAEELTEETKREYLKYLLSLFFTSIVFFFFIWKYADNNVGWYVVLVNIVLMLFMLIFGQTVKIKTENKIFKALVALSSMSTLGIFLQQMYYIQQKNPESMKRIYQDAARLKQNSGRGFRSKQSSDRKRLQTQVKTQNNRRNNY